MRVAKKHPQEQQRLQALQQLKILDTAAEQSFDELTKLASLICECPIALVSLVDEKRQWFKAKVGLGADETHRDLAFCAHAILQEQPLVVEDSKIDVRFQDNPLVTGDPKVEFYAGLPIFEPEYHLPIGTLCVIDNKPRTLTPEQLAQLSLLRNQVQRLIDLRLQNHRLDQLVSHFEAEQQRTEFILEGAGLGAWDWNLITNEVQFDKRWVEMLGYKAGELANDLKTWDERVHPQDKEQAYKDIHNHLSGNTSVYENIHRLKHKNGSWVWILDRGKISGRDETGKPVRFTGTHFDITSYKVKEELQLRIEKMANIGGWELDFASGQTRWTPQTYAIHGIDPSVPTDKIMGVQFYKGEGEQKRLEQWIQSCASGERKSERFEFVDAMGVEKWVEVSAGPVKNAAGQTTGLRGTFQDVSSIVKKEQDLERNKLKSLQNAKLIALGEMSSGIAHEINNPLAIIQSAAEKLADQRIDQEKFLRKLEVIRKAVTRIQKIVAGLKRFSRTGERQAKTLIRVEDLIGEVLTIAELRAKQAGVSFSVSMPDPQEVTCVYGNQIELEQVLVNLVINAIDACEQSSEKSAEFQIRIQGNYVAFEVSDTGQGIPESIRNKIFDPFFTTKDVGKGTGLGLSISKGIVQDHNGELNFTREHGRTKFFCLIPRSNSKCQQAS